MLKNPLRLLLWAIAFAPLVAVSAEPRIDRVEPQGLCRGEEAVVTASGPRLGEAPQQLVLYEPGIEVTGVEAPDKDRVQLTVRVAGDCPLGRHAVRVRTATGLSNLVTLHVGASPRVAEAEPNNTLEAAQAIEFGRTVHGVVQREDEDLYVFDVAEGRRVSVEVEGLRLGRLEFDPYLEVLDADGALIASSDDQTASYQDPFLTLTAPAGGKLFVRMRESAYRGDGRASYLLHVGDFPRPTAVYPPVAQRGAETQVQWADASGLQQSVAVPESAGDHFDAYAQDDHGVAPTALPLLVTDTAPTLEAEPNNGRGEATPFACPGHAAGVIAEPGDRDHFRFEAKQGEVYDLRVRARELRTPLDPVLRVFAADGKRLAGNDDDRGAPDSYVRFNVPADGGYVLQVEDRLGRGAEEYAYAACVERLRRLAEVKLDERRRYEATVLEVPRGGRCAALFTVTRREFGGPLDLSIDDLPAGVTLERFPLAADYNLVPVVLSAEAEAPLAASLSPVTVSLQEGDQQAPIESRFEQQTWLVRGRNNVPVWSHFADRAPVAVTERLPVTITLAPPKAPLCKNGSIDLRVAAQRDEGFDGRVAVRMLYHPPGVSSNASRGVEPAQSDTTIPVTAAGNARLGEWPVAVVGEVNVNGRVYLSTGFVTLRVVDAYFDVAVPTVTTRQGESAELVATLTHRTPFDGAAKLELVGLPPGVTAAPIEVRAGDATAAFQLTVAPDARVSRHRGVGCRVQLTVDGEPVTYRHAYSVLQVDPAEPPPQQSAVVIRHAGDQS